MADRDEANRLMLERIERTKQRDAEDEVRTWRYATPEERGRAIIELARLGQMIIRSRGFPDDRPPLAYPWLPRRDHPA